MTNQDVMLKHHQIVVMIVIGNQLQAIALLYLQNQPKFVTLQLYLSEIRSLFPAAGSESIYCAAAILGMLPLIVIFCILQKYFIEGVSAGSVKE